MIKCFLYDEETVGTEGVARHVAGEMPALDAVQSEYNGDVQLIYVSDEASELLRAWVADRPGAGLHARLDAAALRGPCSRTGAGVSRRARSAGSRRGGRTSGVERP